MQLVDYSHSVLSVVPAFLALALAVITRRVLLSLGIGVIVGVLLLTGGNPLDGLTHLKNLAVSLTWADGAWALDKPKILLFLLLLGIFTSLLTFSGSNQAFADWAKRHIKNRRGAKLLTACLVFVTFIDDYFHSLAVGAIARPVTDKFKVSRAKLAYILDSTAAPMCVLMPVSSWGASIIATIAGLLVTYNITGYTPIGAFVSMSLMNYYALFALIMVFVVAYFSFDIGSMARLERAALKENHVAHENADGKTGRVYALIIPVAVLIASTLASMMYTGAQALETFSILGAFENTDVNTSLVFGGVCGILAVLLCTFGKIDTADYPRAVWVGMKSMFGAITILILAWLISSVVSDMKTGEYLSTLVAGNINPGFLPLILFLLGSVMAFATGTSWGTFGIMLPIAAAMAVKIDPSLIIPCMSAVMAGAVCGDHCSPISDTTILSSTGAQCNHIDHVTTQLPYALTVAAASAVGFLTLGFTQSALLGFAVTGVSLAVLILLLRNKQTA
ncbi:Na+/H+ antiporter NhaC family protein [Neisseria animalis]|uniref:Na+/H+ antiporter NhaC family protein n=1 Tax=Neisseria animalis TaxID=492 RepID=A0A5P3MTV3_NEIAN|nr:Na+/H+ antiporter NhaC family protein [Neisseria animalis]QEY25023.1 Na+/H+ antiporter NhaC family protein [Neisseria animalis]ROW32376.1 Na+/H+ antiporter NhaC family protein [Neisseria animalis]VEE06704.1 integral membrane protein [Neisseria animalis]